MTFSSYSPALWWTCGPSKLGLWWSCTIGWKLQGTLSITVQPAIFFVAHDSDLSSIISTTGGSSSRHWTWTVEVRAQQHSWMARLRQRNEGTGWWSKGKWNGYKHGDGEEDGGSDMGARRPSSKVSIYITIDYVHTFTDTSWRWPHHAHLCIRQASKHMHQAKVQPKVCSPCLHRNALQHQSRSLRCPRPARRSKSQKQWQQREPIGSKQPT